MNISVDELWAQAAARLQAARAWSLRPLASLGQPRSERRTWLGRGEPGMVIVKATTNPSAGERAAWAADALSPLANRGYPAPEVLWHDALDQSWYLVVQTRLPGQPLRALHAPALDDLFALVEHCWDGALAAAPRTSRWLQAFLEPAQGHRLPVGDIVHGDLNLSNVLSCEGAITGVVDWNDVGRWSRAVDLASVLVDWHRRRLAGNAAITPDGGDGTCSGSSRSPVTSAFAAL